MFCWSDCIKTVVSENTLYWRLFHTKLWTVCVFGLCHRELPPLPLRVLLSKKKKTKNKQQKNLYPQHSLISPQWVLHKKEEKLCFVFIFHLVFRNNSELRRILWGKAKPVLPLGNLKLWLFKVYLQSCSTFIATVMRRHPAELGSVDGVKDGCCTKKLTV